VWCYEKEVGRSRVHWRANMGEQNMGEQTLGV